MFFCTLPRGNSARKLLVLLATISLCAGPICAAQESPAAEELQERQPVAAESKTVVVLVRNLSGKPELGAQSKVLSQILAGKLSGTGFSAILQDAALSRLSEYEGNGIRTESELFGSLQSGASAVRLSKMLGASRFLSVSLNSFTSDAKLFRGYGIETFNRTYRLRASYSLHDTTAGIGLTGETVSAERTVRQSENLVVQTEDILPSLLEDIATQIAEAIDKQDRERKIKDVPAAAAESTPITLRCVIENLSFPKLIRQPDGEYVVGTDVVPATLATVSVEIDGVLHTISATGDDDDPAIELEKGIHTLRIVQKDIAPTEERTIFVTGKPNQVISLSLSLTKEARERYKADMRYVSKLIEEQHASERKTERSSAAADALRSLAVKLRRDGISVGNADED